MPRFTRPNPGLSLFLEPDQRELLDFVWHMRQRHGTWPALLSVIVESKRRHKDGRALITSMPEYLTVGNQGGQELVLAGLKGFAANPMGLHILSQAAKVLNIISDHFLQVFPEEAVVTSDDIFIECQVEDTLKDDVTRVLRQLSWFDSWRVPRDGAWGATANLFVLQYRNASDANELLKIRHIRNIPAHVLSPHHLQLMRTVAQEWKRTCQWPEYRAFSAKHIDKYFSPLLITELQDRYLTLESMNGTSQHIALHLHALSITGEAEDALAAFARILSYVINRFTATPGVLRIDQEELERHLDISHDVVGRAVRLFGRANVGITLERTPTTSLLIPQEHCLAYEDIDTYFAFARRRRQLPSHLDKKAIRHAILDTFRAAQDSGYESITQVDLLGSGDYPGDLACYLEAPLTTDEREVALRCVYELAEQELLSTLGAPNEAGEVLFSLPVRTAREVTDRVEHQQPASNRNPMRPDRKRKSFGPWIVEDRIGSGGQGLVYRVRHSDNGRTCALKWLKKTEEKAQERFRQEADVQRRLGPTIAMPIIELGYDDRRQNVNTIVMQLAEAGSLADQLPFTKGNLERAVKMLRKILLLVNQCHAQGIIHRDLKPENILFPDDPNNPRLGDFGTCFLIEAHGGTRHTATSERVGSRGFLAPEQDWGRNTAVDARADIFSMGKILHWALTGRITEGARLLPAEEFEKEFHDPRYRYVYQWLSQRVVVEERELRATSVSQLVLELDDLSQRLFSFVPGEPAADLEVPQGEDPNRWIEARSIIGRIPPKEVDVLRSISKHQGDRRNTDLRSVSNDQRLPTDVVLSRLAESFRYNLVSMIIPMVLESDRGNQTLSLTELGKSFLKAQQQSGLL